MRRVLLIFLSLVLALAGWTTVGAEDGFYVIPTVRGEYAPVPKTGQTTSYTTPPIDDGGLQKGVAWPTPRFTDNSNGTVTDKLTRLIWMKNANYFATLSLRTWHQALIDANSLKSGDAGLTGGSQEGDWRLPNVRELQSLIDYGRWNPALPAVHPFTNVQSLGYWSSTSYARDGYGPEYAGYVSFHDGTVNYYDKNYGYLVWCVRGGP